MTTNNISTRIHIHIESLVRIQTYVESLKADNKIIRIQLTHGKVKQKTTTKLTYTIRQIQMQIQT